MKLIGFANFFLAGNGQVILLHRQELPATTKKVAEATFK
jgi:hypothetical protein